jgi:ubiquinone/menaquinone biosynthesis C-methylase UbiE
VSDARALLVCPACRSELSADWNCTVCPARFEARDGIPNLRLDGPSTIEAVRQFYEAAPFPGYPERDSLSTFRARAGRSRFVELLDRAIPGDARVAEVGCGTGQMSLYLARADRVMVASDLSRSSLLLGAAAARRFGINAVQFVETDLHRSALRSGAFDVVYSSGVLHHTPNPRAAFAEVARLARPGGTVIIGVYNAIARIPLRIKRTLARAAGFRVVPFDAVLRDRRGDPARREAWLRDQYRHPEEHSHTIAEVKEWFSDNDVDYLRSFPSTVLDDEGEDLFAPAVDDWRLESWIAQLGWMWALGGEGGLFVTIGRRR